MSDVGLGLAQNEIYASISGIDFGTDSWATTGGPRFSTTSEKHYNGGLPTPLRYRGRATFDTITLSRPAMFPRDLDTLTRLRADVKAGNILRTITFYYEQNGVVNRPESYIGYVNEVTPPDGDADGTGATRLSCVIEVIDSV